MRWPRLTAEVLPLLTTISPLIGAATTVAMSRWNAPLVRPMALSNSAMTLMLAIAALGMCQSAETDDPANARIPVQPGITWLADPASEQPDNPAVRGMRFRLSFGVDGLSVWPAVVLSLTVWAVLCGSGRLSTASFSSHCVWLMTSQALLLASCFATDAVAALVFLEMALLPIYVLIGTCGEEGRRSVAGAWSLWQMIGCTSSLLGVTLLAVSQPWMTSDMVASRGAALFDTSLLADSLRHSLAHSEAAWHLWGHLAPWGAALLLLGFLIRLPVFPFLGWYQSTLVAAPSGVSAVIAVAFPLAAFSAWLRLGVPSFADNSAVAGVVAATSLAGVLQSAFALQSQTDLKRIMATVSCTLLGLAGVGLSFQNGDGIRGAWLLILSQGLAVAAGMLLVQILESRCGTRDLTRLTDHVKRVPRLTAVLVIVLLGFAGIPVVSGFAALHLQLWSSSGAGWWMIAGLSVAIVGVATAAIRAFALVMTRPHPAASVAGTLPVSAARSDIGGSELAALVPILALLLLLNAAPTAVLKSCEPAFHRLFRRTEQRAVGSIQTPFQTAPAPLEVRDVSTPESDVRPK